MVNVKAYVLSGRVFCGRELCGHTIGSLCDNNNYVQLDSHRSCVLFHQSTMTEYNYNGAVNLTVNRLVENDGPVSLGGIEFLDDFETGMCYYNGVGLDGIPISSELICETSDVEVIPNNCETLCEVVNNNINLDSGIDANDFNMIVHGITDIDTLDLCFLDYLVDELIRENSEEDFDGPQNFQNVAGPFYNILPPDDGDLIPL